MYKEQSVFNTYNWKLVEITVHPCSVNTQQLIFKILSVNTIKLY